jgi:hypothetical protein
LIAWNPVETARFGISMFNGKDVAKLKTYLTELHYLVKAKTIVVNSDTSTQLLLRAKLLQSPYPVGLREDNYCVTFWELI